MQSSKAKLTDAINPSKIRDCKHLGDKFNNPTTSNKPH